MGRLRTTVARAARRVRRIEADVAAIRAGQPLPRDRVRRAQKHGSAFVRERAGRAALVSMRRRPSDPVKVEDLRAACEAMDIDPQEWLVQHGLYVDDEGLVRKGKRT